MIGMQLGVPEEAFTILPGDARSTQDEGRLVGEYLSRDEDIRRILLVISRYHSARVLEWALRDLRPEVYVILPYHL